MSLQRMDADTAETVAGVIRLLRRAAELVWAAVDVEAAGSPRQLLALGIDLAADDARNLLPDAIPRAPSLASLTGPDQLKSVPCSWMPMDSRPGNETC